MHFIKTRLGRSRLTAMFLTVVLCVLAFSPVFTVSAAIESVKSPDGLTTYSDGGSTYVSGNTTVLVSYSSVDAYYMIASGEWVDVYYGDVPGQPNGSYFPGNQNPAVNEGFVTNLGAPSASNGGVALGSNSLIKVDLPGDGGRSTLVIATYSNGLLQGIYKHTFINFLGNLSMTTDKNDINVIFRNNSKEAVTAMVVLAAYNTGDQLISVMTPDISGSVVAARGGIVDYSTSKIAGAAYYKAYVWNTSTFIPMLPSVTVGN